MDNNHIVIDAHELGKRFGDQVAVQGVSFQVPRGNIFGFIGPSGSGKTTTIRLLLGVYKPTEGKALVLGDEAGHFTKETRARIGYMPQLSVLYRDLSVWENLNFAASIYGMSPLRGKRLQELLHFVELSEHQHKLVRNLSGGMQRRLSLASTLVHDPELLYLDEPTAGVDPVLRRKFWDHFEALKKQGHTLFVTTQYVSEAAYCDLVGVLANGRLSTVDTPHGLRHQAFGGDLVEIRAATDIAYDHLLFLGRQPFVRANVERLDNRRVRLVVDEAATAIPALLDRCREQGLEIESIEEYLPPFDDVFVELVKTEPANG